jgi:hypothetical protein
MPKSFKFDCKATVATALANDTEDYIIDRIQEVSGTKYGGIIERSVDAALPYDKTAENKLQRLAFFAGAAVVLESFDHADLSSFQIGYLKHVLSCRGIPTELKKIVAETTKEQIEFNASLGHASHPELQPITYQIKQYYTEICSPSLQLPVRNGTGIMAFALDQCIGSSNPVYDIARTLEETDWLSIEPEDIMR